jgi:hypothetical protein
VTHQASFVIITRDEQGFFAQSIKSCIGFGPFVEVLSRCQPPPKLLQFFAQQIQPFEERLRVCVKCKQWALCVEVRSGVLIAGSTH